METKGKDKFDLTQGSILDKLLLIAVPLMGTQIMQMAYNLTDMFWLGKIGSDIVAASGTAGMFLWLSMSLVVFGRMGSEIGVSQNLGRGDRDEAKKFASTAFILSIVLGIFFAAFLVIFRNQLIGFFKIQEENVVRLTINYLVIVSFGLPFSFLNASITGIFNGSGNSRLPFMINAVGLIINMILDPLVIIKWNLGIEGAAAATVFAQGAVSVLSIMALLKHKDRPFDKIKLIHMPDIKVLKQIFKWATPISVESFLFTFLSMFISRFVAEWGSDAMATQRISSQIESLSWLIAGGFSSALTAFIGQNFGGAKWSRIHKGFSISTIAMGLWGIIVTYVLFFHGETIFAFFLPGEPHVIKMGGNYLRILAVCQVVSCLEGIASGAFRGVGKTLPPSLTSVTCNFTRVIFAYFLSRTALGLDGIWWAVSIGAGVRGLWMFIWFKTYQRQLPKEDSEFVNVVV